jgi:hypothetical protein
MTRLFLLENPKAELWPQGTDGAPAAAGACARCPIESHFGQPGRSYVCWMVRLPGDGGWWHTNMKSTDEPRAYWTVTGEAPNFTVTPSINVGPEWWHGWITGGELTPDADRNGRTGPHPVEQWRRVRYRSGRTVRIERRTRLRNGSGG